MKRTPLKLIAIVGLAAVATAGQAGSGKATLVPSPFGNGWTSSSGTGACADVTFSGERGSSTFHVESIVNRACGQGEAQGSRTYTQVNPTGPGAGGQRPLR